MDGARPAGAHPRLDGGRRRGLGRRRRQRHRHDAAEIVRRRRLDQRRLDYALRLFPESLFAGERRVIDVSGDGANNNGRPAGAARDAAVAAGIVINGLPILALEPDLDLYYRNNVVGGAGAFVVAVDSFEHFGDAILNKLITEIAGANGGMMRHAAR
jgi:hypothetical protein